MSSLQNQYTVQKTIGFYANPSLKIETNNQNLVLDTSFATNLQDLAKNLSSLLYSQKGGYNKGLKVRKIWAKEYCNKEIRQKILNDRLTVESQNKKYPPVKDLDLDIDFISDHIKNWFEVLEEVSQNILSWLEYESKMKNLHKEGKKIEDKTTKASLNVLLKKLCQKSVLPSIIEFLNRDKNKNTSENDVFNDQIKEQAKSIELQSRSILSDNLQDTMSGSRLLKATLNYNTINKLPKSEDDYKKEIAKLQEELKAKSQLTGTIFTTVGLPIPSEPTTLSERSNLLKNFKSEQKAKFNERIGYFLQQGFDETSLDYYSLIEKFPIFAPTKGKEDKLQEYIKRSIEIIDKNKVYNQTKDYKLNQEIQSLAKKRGKEYFMDNCYNYKQYCEIYKSLRMKEGATLGKIKNLEAEQLESQTLTHWALLSEQNSKINVILIPKLAREEIKKFLLSNVAKPLDNFLFNYIQIRELKSLTLRALIKQIEVNRLYHGEITDLGESPTQEQKDIITVKYCVQQLRGGTLDLASFDLDLDNLATETNLETFKRRLEYKCYKFVLYYIPKGDYQKHFDGLQTLNLDSFDIVKRPDLSRLNPENHTNIWDKFLKVLDKDGKGETRLNPEFSLNYRNALESEPTIFTRLGKITTKENRRNKPKVRILFSVSENTNKHQPKTTKIKTFEQINEFNTKFNSDIKPKFFDAQGYATLYGIDRGNDEMATLCKVKLNPNIVYDSPATILKKTANFPLYEPKFEPFEFYRLKNGVSVFENLELQQLLKNPSYYLTDFEGRIGVFNQYFEVVSSSCLDLTRAKLIKSQFHNKSIILEVGDLFTYLTFVLETAKSKIYTLILEGGKNYKELVLDSKKNALSFDTGEKYIDKKDKIEYPIYENIYFYKQELNTKPIDEIKVELELFVVELRDKLKVSQYQPNELERKKLWNLKSAITANTIGIINHLYQQDSGFIVLENLDLESIEKQTKDKTAIHRQLEKAFYQKWQNYGTVPPKVNVVSMWKELFNNYEDESKSVQLGNILIVDENCTSKSCPKCGIVNHDYSDGVKQKWNGHYFSCITKETGNCGFSTRENENTLSENKFLELNNSDSVASYNIAKRGLEFITILKINNSQNTVIIQNTNNISRQNNNFQPKSRN